MHVNFAGIIRQSVEGAKLPEKDLEKLKAEVAAAKGKADTIQASALGGNEALLITGADTHAFFKREGIDFPEALKGKTKRDLPGLIGKPEVRTFIEKAQELLFDYFTVWSKIKAYYESRKAAGSDIEGNPIQEVSV